VVRVWFLYPGDLSTSTCCIVGSFVLQPVGESLLLVKESLQTILELVHDDTEHRDEVGVGALLERLE
jgi:hypothetical protein